MATSSSYMARIPIVTEISGGGAETTDETVEVKYNAIAYGGE